MSAKSAAPLLALWSRDDPRTAVIDFLPTSTIAVLAMIAKPLREAQSRLLITAIRRRGKTNIPSPPTTRALLDALTIGEPKHFCGDWERAFLPHCQVCDVEEQLARHSSVEQSPDGGYFLELNGSGHNHRGYALSLPARNLLVKRLRVSMSYVDCFRVPHGSGAVGYVMLCGPDAPTHPYAGHSAIDDFMGGLRFSLRENEQVSLMWLQYNPENNQDHVLVEGTEPNTTYLVDATFRHESTSCFGTVDISVNGQTVAEGIPIVYSPLRSIHLYNYGPAISMIGGIEIWSERAAPNQVWKSDLGDY